MLLWCGASTDDRSGMQGFEQVARSLKGIARDVSQLKSQDELSYAISRTSKNEDQGSAQDAICSQSLSLRHASMNFQTPNDKTTEFASCPSGNVISVFDRHALGLSHVSTLQTNSILLDVPYD